MKPKNITSRGIALTLAVMFLQTPVLRGYTYKKRELKVRTTAYTHNESDHLIYGRKSALGTQLKFSRDYSSAAADWSRFPVGTEFRVKGINRHFVVDDYGRALLGTDTIDIYFPSRSKMNCWGVQIVDIIITKYGDFEKSREILDQRKHFKHCNTMLTKIEENALDSSKEQEAYETVPAVPTDIDQDLMAAASIPENEWTLPSPSLETDLRQPVIRNKTRRSREVYATNFRTPGQWTLFKKQRSGQITIPVQAFSTKANPGQNRAPAEYKPIRKIRLFRAIRSINPD